MPEVFSISKAIIIPTHPNFQHWLLDCLHSLKGCKYPIVIVHNYDDNNEYEMRAVKYGKEHFDEFVVLHDTTVVKDQLMFDAMFSRPETVFMNSQGQMFLNKYVSSQLPPSLPFVHDKRTAVNAETTLHNDIRKLFPVFVLDPDFKDGDKREEKHGRTNMVIENDYIIKYKGCWSPEMIK